ncbi:MAG: archaellin/type IV pilin N-terminal domain-containing protein [Candidatus Nanoarchaeia archaeon]
MMYKKKKAEMGVGTLIVFIAMLLVAAVAAGVLIQTATSLQEKSLATGQQARSQISTNARVVEVSGTDGRDGNLTDFQQIVKLSPGSDPIKLDQVIFTFNTKDSTSTLKYRGEDSVCEKDNEDGYNTWTEEYPEIVNTSTTKLEEDYDDDGGDDSIYLGEGENATYVYFNLSEEGIIGLDTGINFSDVGSTGRQVDYHGEIEDDTGTYADINISGNQTENATLEDMVEVVPYKLGEGYFSVVYEQVGNNHVPGNLQRGDIIRLCYEGPEEVTEDQQVRLNFIPKIGTPTLTQFATPDVISTQRVYLYP